MRVHFRGKESEGLLTVSTDNQSLPSLLPAVFDHVASAGGGFPGEESVCFLSLSLRGLVGSLHLTGLQARPGETRAGGNLNFRLDKGRIIIYAAFPVNR